MKTIDLHVHTTASDGTYTPIELVEYAVEKKLAAVALTDHDTMRGVLEAIDHVNKNRLPLEVIPGIEVSTSGIGNVYGIHILAYFVDKSFEKRLNIIRNLEVELARSSGRPHEVLKIILEFDGIPVLAHPKDYFLSMDEMDQLVGKLAALGLKGVECIYTTHSDDEIKQLKKIAAKHNLIFTGGTDFHGARKLGVDLGSGFGGLNIPYSIIDSLKVLEEKLR